MVNCGIKQTKASQMLGTREEAPNLGMIHHSHARVRKNNTDHEHKSYRMDFPTGFSITSVSLEQI